MPRKTNAQLLEENKKLKNLNEKLIVMVESARNHYAEIDKHLDLVGGTVKASHTVYKNLVDTLEDVRNDNRN